MYNEKKQEEYLTVLLSLEGDLGGPFLMCIFSSSTHAANSSMVDLQGREGKRKCVCVCVCVSERERERDREIDFDIHLMPHTLQSTLFVYMCTPTFSLLLLVYLLLLLCVCSTAFVCADSHPHPVFMCAVCATMCFSHTRYEGEQGVQ